MRRFRFALSNEGRSINFRAMPGAANPAIEALTRSCSEEWVWAQVLIRRKGEGFELRHVHDEQSNVEQLRVVVVGQLRKLAMHTEGGAFRPLKSAPNLRSGWRATVRDPAELGLALNELYPGSVADWFAARRPNPPVTGYREFTARQSGMYRITTFLDDPQAAEVARAVCHKRFCLKQRLWTVGDAGVDEVGEKSVIPCLEPCAVLLEMARKAARLAQEPKMVVELAPGELESMAAALEQALTLPDPVVRVADFAAPANPRRLQLLLEKLRERLKVAGSAKHED